MQFLTSSLGAILDSKTYLDPSLHKVCKNGLEKLFTFTNDWAMSSWSYCICLNAKNQQKTFFKMLFLTSSHGPNLDSKTYSDSSLPGLLENGK